MSDKKENLFNDLSGDLSAQETTEIDSLCMNCHADGKTRLLLTKIPFYKEVVIMSFSCDECGFKNNELQSAATVADKGIKITLKVEEACDFNRQVVKSDYTSVKIVELDFEIPSQSQKGEVTTLESMLDRSICGLEQDQPLRRIQHPDAATQIDEFIEKLKNLKHLKTPFTIIFDDISGNTFVENPYVPKKDPRCTIHQYVRNKDQDHILGCFTKEEVRSKGDGMLHPIEENEFTLEDIDAEVLQFQTNCPNCGNLCDTNMKVTNIPHFKQVVIMATVCDACGHRTNEVKAGGGIEKQGLRIEVDVRSRDDFSRDLLKSETCMVNIPELDLESGASALGGRFTTVEGLLIATRDQVIEHSHMFSDTKNPEIQERMDTFMKEFNLILEAKKPVTIILDDPAGNSYIQSLSDEDKPDDALRIIRYDRTFEQNEELGLNDMKTENYS